MCIDHLSYLASRNRIADTDHLFNSWFISKSLIGLNSAHFDLNCHSPNDCDFGIIAVCLTRPGSFERLDALAFEANTVN